MHGFAVPLLFTARPPRRALAVWLALHGLAAALVIVVWPWSPGVACCACGILVAGLASHRELLALPRNFVAVLVTHDGRYVLTDARGARHPATPASPPVVGHNFVLLALRVGRRRWPWLVTRETAAPDALRRLRVRLQNGSAMPATTSAAV
jgi:hypothetical protein